jgi:uncharacterized protein (TIGR03435 family)
LVDGGFRIAVVRLRHLVTGILIVSTPVAAQRVDVANGPRFEVASIKPATIADDVLASMNKLATCGLVGFDRSGSRVHVGPAPVCSLIRLAYNVNNYQVIGVPRDLAQTDAGNWFEIGARADAGIEPTIDQARTMLQALLADRFQLRIHREIREMPVYALTVAKGGPKWTPCSNPEAPTVFQPGRLDNCKPPLMPMARVAQLLIRDVGRPVIDRTGLAEASFELRYLPDGVAPLPDSPPSLFTALEEQLGLRLEPQRAPVDTIVVDQVARPTAN